MLTKANARGYAILALVINHLNDDEVKQLQVEPYLNGRESGFSVMFWPFHQANNCYFDRKLVFSENRNSDCTVVYEGTLSDFGMNNELSDNVWKNSRLFDYDKPYETARHIIGRLQEVDSTKVPF